MEPISKSDAPKKPTNVCINSDLLAQAKRLKINLSATLEQALEIKLQAARQDEWLKENQKGIDTCNELAEKYGLFADKHRTF